MTSDTGTSTYYENLSLPSSTLSANILYSGSYISTAEIRQTISGNIAFKNLTGSSTLATLDTSGVFTPKTLSLNNGGDFFNILCSTDRYLKFNNGTTSCIKIDATDNSVIIPNNLSVLGSSLSVPTLYENGSGVGFTFKNSSGTTILSIDTNGNFRNAKNLSKQLWSYALVNTTSSITYSPTTATLPTTCQSLMNNTCSSSNTIRVTIPYNFMNETSIKFTYYIANVTAGQSVQMVFRLSNPDGTNNQYQTSGLYTSSSSATTQYSISLNTSGLSTGNTYMLSIIDVASIAGVTYTLKNPEISLYY